MKLAFGFLGLTVLLAAGVWMLPRGSQAPGAVAPAGSSPGAPDQAPADLQGLGAPVEAREGSPPMEGTLPVSILERRVHGRVTERGDGSGVTGTLLWLEDEEHRMLEEVRSEPNGTFAFQAWPNAHSLGIDPSPVFLPVAAPRVLTPAQRTGAEPLAIELRRALRGRLRGIALDSKGQSVPWLSFRLFDSADTDEDLRTDAAGRFETTQEFREGQVQVRCAEATWESTSLERGAFDDPQWPFAELELTFHIGPTLSLCLSGPGADSTDLRGRLAGLSDPNAALWLEHGPPVRHEGEEPWIRFPEDLAIPGPPYLLLVGDPFGTALGTAEVASLSPSGCVAVHLRERERLEVQVQDPEGRPVGQARVELLNADGSLRASALTRLLREDGEARATFTDLDPGTARVRITKPGWVTLERDVELPGPRLDCVLERRADLGSVSGTFVIQGETQPWIWATLVPLGPGGSQVRSELGEAEWIEGQIRIPFRFEEVPAGRYKIESGAQQPAYFFLTRPSPFEVVAPASHLEVPIEFPPILQLEVDLRLADDTEPTFPRLHARDDPRSWEPYRGWNPMPRSGPKGTFVAEGVPARGTFHWTLLHEGYRPGSGTRADLEVRGDSLHVSLELEPGWGRVLSAVDRESNTLVDGVTILADGEVVLVTSSSRPNVISLPSRPERLSVAPGEWEVEPGGGVDPRSGAFHGDAFEIYLPLRRSE